MRINCFIASTLLLLTTQKELSSQVIPSDNSILNYTHLIFDFPLVENAAYYQLSFIDINESKPFHIQIDSTNVSFCNLFSYGNQYRWNYEAFDAQSQTLFKSENFAFSVVKNVNYDTFQYAALHRGDYNTGFLTNDFSRNVMDWNGKEIWRFPKLKGSIFQGELEVRDLRMTREGTFTCLIINSILLEFDRDGKILWIAPGSQINNQITKENYHHDFRKLNSGNYLTLSEKEYMAPLKLSKSQFQELQGKETIVEQNGKLFTMGNWATVIEYDKSGKEVWRWESGEYFASMVEDGWTNTDTHANAFYLDEINDHLYLGFRHISLLLKLDRKTKKVIHTYGDRLSKNQRVSLIGDLGLQHSIEKLSNNHLLVFNNNSIEVDSSNTSNVLFIDEKDNINAEIIYKFNCLIDQNDDGKAAKYGSAEELPDRKIMIGIGALGRIVLLDPTNNYEIKQDLILKVYTDKKWSTQVFYRCHYTPSLYPTYFSCKKDLEGFEIQNEGQYEDVYTIELTLEGGKTLKLSSPSIKMEEKFHYVFGNERVKSVKIQSTYNPRLIRYLGW